MLSHSEKSRPYIYLLYLAFLGVCIGRAYQCIFWDIPIRSLVWNEEWMTSIVSGILELSWEDYLKHPNGDTTIQVLVSTLGYTLLVVAALVVLKIKRWLTDTGLFISFFVLVFIAFLYHLEKFQTAGQFLEYSLQFLCPLLLWYYFKNGITKRWILALKVAIALTFISHGLYALGFYPVPANFVSMTIQILPLGNEAAVQFLYIIGIVDILFSIGLFLKGFIFRISIWYCMIWGTLTTSARIVANVDLSNFGETMHQWWFESMYRLPHVLIPLLLYLVVKQISKEEK